MPDTGSQPRSRRPDPPGDEAAAIAEILVASGQVENYVRGTLALLDEHARLKRALDQARRALGRLGAADFD